MLFQLGQCNERCQKCWDKGLSLALAEKIFLVAHNNMQSDDGKLFCFFIPSFTLGLVKGNRNGERLLFYTLINRIEDCFGEHAGLSKNVCVVERRGSDADIAIS